MKTTLKDQLNLISKVTVRRMLNVLKVVSSFYFSRLLRKPVQWGKPITISIEPTTACNLRCPECPSGLRAFSRPTGNLKQPLFQQIIDEQAKELLYLIFYFQGEPYINPDFLDMVNYASKKGIYTTTSTNGHFLSQENVEKTLDSGLDRIIISLDGTTQEVYENYRKEGKLDQVIEGTKRLVAEKKRRNVSKPHIVFQFLVVKPNEHQIPEIEQLTQDLGVDELKLKSAQVYDFKNGNPLIPDNLKYSRYKPLGNGEWVIKNKLLNHCWKLWHSCVITWDGGVVPCCFDKDAKYRFGDLKDDSFEEIWHNDSYRQFRTQILKGRDQIDICNNCTEGTKVWL